MDYGQAIANYRRMCVERVAFNILDDAFRTDVREEVIQMARKRAAVRHSMKPGLHTQNDMVAALDKPEEHQPSVPMQSRPPLGEPPRFSEIRTVTTMKDGKIRSTTTTTESY